VYVTAIWAVAVTIMVGVEVEAITMVGGIIVMGGWPPTCKSFFVMWSLAVMCPAFLRGLTWPLALMDSADRGLISWAGLERR
jgi:hypothetical protein